MVYAIISSIFSQYGSTSVWQIMIFNNYAVGLRTCLIYVPLHFAKLNNYYYRTFFRLGLVVIFVKKYVYCIAVFLSYNWEMTGIWSKSENVWKYMFFIEHYISKKNCSCSVKFHINLVAIINLELLFSEYKFTLYMPHKCATLYKSWDRYISKASRLFKIFPVLD